MPAEQLVSEVIQGMMQMLFGCMYLLTYLLQKHVILGEGGERTRIILCMDGDISEKFLLFNWYLGTFTVLAWYALFN